MFFSCDHWWSLTTATLSAKIKSSCATKSRRYFSNLLEVSCYFCILAFEFGSKGG